MRQQMRIMQRTMRRRSSIARMSQNHHGNPVLAGAAGCGEGAAGGGGFGAGGCSS